MAQAIRVERGPRIMKASCFEGKLDIPLNEDLSAEENFEEACEALLKQLEWDGYWIGGSLHIPYRSTVVFTRCMDITPEMMDGPGPMAFFRKGLEHDLRLGDG